MVPVYDKLTNHGFSLFVFVLESRIGLLAIRYLLSLVCNIEPQFFIVFLIEIVVSFHRLLYYIICRWRHFCKEYIPLFTYFTASGLPLISLSVFLIVHLHVSFIYTQSAHVQRRMKLSAGRVNQAMTTNKKHLITLAMCINELQLTRLVVTGCLLCLSTAWSVRPRVDREWTTACITITV